MNRRGFLKSTATGLLSVLGLATTAEATMHAGECFEKGWFNGHNFNPAYGLSERVLVEGNTQGLTIYDYENSRIRFIFHADAKRV